MVEINGKLYNGPKLARTIGVVAWSVVYMRLKLGWEPYNAFHEPLARPGKAPSLEDRLADHRRRMAWHAEQIASIERQIKARESRNAGRIDRINSMIVEAESL